MNEIYSHFPGDTLPPHSSQQHVPSPNVRNSTRSVRYWTQFSDWYTTLPHMILYQSFDDLVLRLNRTTLDQLRHVSRLMAQHNARVAHQLRDDWRDILLRVASNSPNRPRWCLKSNLCGTTSQCQTDHGGMEFTEDSRSTTVRHNYTRPTTGSAVACSRRQLVITTPESGPVLWSRDRGFVTRVHFTKVSKPKGQGLVLDLLSNLVLNFY